MVHVFTGEIYQISHVFHEHLSIRQRLVQSVVGRRYKAIGKDPEGRYSE
jgi:hypothetical protein